VVGNFDLLRFLRAAAS